MTWHKSKVVLANGCFDVFHYGHLRHLEAAKRLGDILIVSITADAHVNKGPDRPVFNHYQRQSVIQALRCVDRAMVVDHLDEALHLIKPDVFVKGIEYKGKIRPEHLAYCAENGIEIAYTDEPTFSSTALLHHYDLARQG